MQNLKIFTTALLAASILIPSVKAGQPDDVGGPPEIVKHSANPSRGYAPAVGSNNKVNPTISYHGGPVISAPNVYVIWYGAWTDHQQGIIRDFLNSIGGSPYFNINKTYSTFQTVINGDVTFTGEFTDSTYAGTTLSDQDIANIVANAIGVGTPDVNGVYFVLTGSNVKKSGFCTQYCGWHTDGTLGVSDVKYAFVGNPSACPLVGASVGNCSAQTASSPNGDVGVDAMISVIAHELEEATTDPDLNAWWNSRNGNENADTCAWTFGTQFSVSDPVKNTSAYANVTLSTPGTSTAPSITRNYLIQRNLVRVSNANYCAKGINDNGTLIK